MSESRQRRGQRGVVFPSPVVILSIIAVAMAGVAFLFTQGSGDQDREVTTTSQQQTMTPSPTGSSSAVSAPGSPSAAASKSAGAKAKPTVDRATTSVVVFNNSRISGLAAQVSSKVSQVGWQVAGTDNWYGTIPTTTVYYPSGMKAAGRQLALDLGISRTAPAVDPMQSDQLTVILTGPLA